MNSPIDTALAANDIIASIREHEGNGVADVVDILYMAKLGMMLVSEEKAHMVIASLSALAAAKVSELHSLTEEQMTSTTAWADRIIHMVYRNAQGEMQ